MDFVAVMVYHGCGQDLGLCLNLFLLSHSDNFELLTSTLMVQCMQKHHKIISATCTSFSET